MESSIHQMNSALTSFSSMFSVSSFISLHLSHTLASFARWMRQGSPYAEPSIVASSAFMPMIVASISIVVRWATPRIALNRRSHKHLHDLEDLALDAHSLRV